MNEFVIISKDVFEEMVGKFNRFSDKIFFCTKTHNRIPLLNHHEQSTLFQWQ